VLVDARTSAQLRGRTRSSVLSLSLSLSLALCSCSRLENTATPTRPSGWLALKHTIFADSVSLCASRKFFCSLDKRDIFEFARGRFADAARDASRDDRLAPVTKTFSGLFRCDKSLHQVSFEAYIAPSATTQRHLLKRRARFPRFIRDTLLPLKRIFEFTRLRRCRLRNVQPRPRQRGDPRGNNDERHFRSLERRSFVKLEESLCADAACHLYPPTRGGGWGGGCFFPLAQTADGPRNNRGWGEREREREGERKIYR